MSYLVRHGTAWFNAALGVAPGKVTAGVVARNDSVHFIEFLDQLEASIDPALAIHLVIARRGEFDSRDDLVARMLAFIEPRNQTAQPSNWVYDAKEAA